MHANQLIPPALGQREHSVQNVFVLAVTAAFATSVLLVLLLGAKIYRNAQAQTEQNFTGYTARAYITQKVRHADSAGQIETGQFHGLTALVFKEKQEETTFVTYLYVRDGWLCELMCEENTTLDLDAGSRILKLSGFSCTKNNHLIEVGLTNQAGKTDTLTLCLRSGSKEEQP